MIKLRPALAVDILRTHLAIVDVTFVVSHRICRRWRHGWS